jgi:hypothetical protein
MKKSYYWIIWITIEKCIYIYMHSAKNFHKPLPKLRMTSTTRDFHNVSVYIDLFI